MYSVELSKKARKEYMNAENEIKKSCCSMPSYEMALPSYSKAYVWYKSLKENAMVIEISDKIILCNQKIKNYIGIAIQYENIADYLTMFAPVHFTDICKYYKLGYHAYLDVGNIHKSALMLIKNLKYLDKIKYDDKIKYLEIIDKTIKITGSFVETDYVYKIDILKVLFTYVVKYTDKTQTTDYMEIMIKVFRQLNQPHNIHTIMLSNILYLISNYYFEDASKMLNEYYQLDNFIITEQCEIARKILFLCNGDMQVTNLKEELDILLKNNALHMVIKEIYVKIKGINIEKIKEINKENMYKNLDIL